jgi:hypothetical protein
MSIETTTSVEITPEIIDVTIENSGDLVVGNAHEVCVQTPEDIIEVAKKEYAIVGDALFASVSTDEAPSWLTGLIDNLVDVSLTAGLLDYNQLRTDVLAAIDSIDVAANTYVEQINFSQDVDSAISTRLTTFNATLGTTYSTKIELTALVATETEALALDITDLSATLTADINARVTTINLALANETSARTASIDALTSVYLDQASDIQGSADAVSGLQTYVGLDVTSNPNGTGLLNTVTSHSAAFTNLASSTTGPSGDVAFALSNLEQENIVRTNELGTDIRNTFAYDSTIIIDGEYYKTGFGINSTATGGVSEQTAFASEFWINAEKLILKSPTYPGLQAAFQVTPTGISLGLEYTEATRNDPKGAYNAGTTYAVGDMVTYLGSSYVALAAHTGITPVDGASWQLLSAVGDTGATGPTGPTGSTGATGERGVAVLSYSGDLGGVAPGSVSSGNLASYWNTAATPSGFTTEKAGDTLVVTNTNTGSGWTHIYTFNGSVWTTATALTVNGNQVVTGTLAASALVANELRSTSNATSGQPKFLLDLDGQATFSGITILDDAGNTLMSSGAPMDYNVLGGTKPPPNADVTSDNTAGNGSNICNARYSTFQESSIPLSGTANGTAIIDVTTNYFGPNSYSLRLAPTAPDCYTYLGSSTSDFNVPVQGGQSYIVSAYVYSTVANAAIDFWFNQDSFVHVVGTTNSGPANQWNRVSAVVTADAGVRMAMLRVDSDGGAGSLMWFDGIMIEPRVGTLTAPGPYVPPSSYNNVASTFANQGAFATLAQITGANISTYIAGAAIDTAYIKNAAINNALIYYLQVSTLKIGDNAVTAVLTSFTAAATANGLLQSRSITTTVAGGTVEVRAQGYIGIVAGGGGGQFVYFNLYRDGVLLKTITTRAQADGTLYDTATVLHEDTPGIGTFNYTLTRTGWAANVSDRYISVREFKK